METPVWSGLIAADRAAGRYIADAVGASDGLSS